MRQHARYFYVLFFIVILSFIFWGVGTLDNGTPSTIAEIGKHRISAQEYWRAYERAFKFYQDIYKEKFDQEMQNKLNLQESVLTTLVDSKTLLVAAEKFGIAVSDEELREAITHEPAFLNKGVFDKNLYTNTLRISRITPEEYESLKRQDLITLKTRRFIELSATVPEPDLSSVSGDEATVKAIKQALIKDSKEKVVRAYLAGLKKGINIKIYAERL